MKKRIEDREAMKAAILVLMEDMRIPENELEIWEDDDESFSVGFDFKGMLAVGIELGFQNGVETAFSASYQDLQFPTDGYEEADTIEDAMNVVEGWCEYAEGNYRENNRW